MITGPLPSGDDGAPVMLSPGYWLRRDAVEALGGSGEVLRALNDAVGGPVELDREYSEEELRNSPYRDVMRDAVVAGPDEYRSGPPDGLGQRGE
ncbi:hypothetical protein [Mycolicibacterium mucogenicum]|uniref:Uncharacterized protein n=1 Tax=Mycolicibacterium mucogenicum DSM 44124 TaxID=1226753 RepID=A0A8E4R981_MYCMU|nr:hypothetical protein [Mycolicibacterium mucogenicum]QPG70003.1 hypothetical protein C1S78_002955 [Mycolicibacterium mucogenicum DSM 44124]